MSMPTSCRFTIHAGAVTTGRGCLLFPGSHGSDKTTFTASLIAAGFGFLSDEIVLLEPHTLRFGRHRSR